WNAWVDRQAEMALQDLFCPQLAGEIGIRKRKVFLASLGIVDLCGGPSFGINAVHDAPGATSPVLLANHSCETASLNSFENFAELRSADEEHTMGQLIAHFCRIRGAPKFER